MPNPYDPVRVPSQIYDEFLRIIGAQRGPFIYFANCTAIMAELPDIKIDFLGGHIILGPEDYVKRLVVVDTCQLSISEGIFREFCTD